MSRVALKLLVLPISMIWAFPLASLALTSSIYVNQNYGYTSLIPKGLKIETDEPPSPNHGFEITLGPRRELWVDASYDAALWGSAAISAQKEACLAGLLTSLSMRYATLSGLPAARVSGRVKYSIVDIMIAYRVNFGGSAVIYTFGLKTDDKHIRSDEQRFDEIIAGFRITLQ